MGRGLGASACLEQGSRTEEAVDRPPCGFPFRRDHRASITQDQRPPCPLWSACLHRWFQDPSRQHGRCWGPTGSGPELSSD